MATVTERKRKNKDGTEKTFFQARIVRAGIPPMSKAFPTRREAEKWAREIETRIDKGGKTFSIKAEKTLVSEALADFSEGTNAGYSEKLRLQRLAVDFEGWTVGKLTWKNLQKWLDLLAKTPISQPENRKKFHPLYDGKTPRVYSPAACRQFYFTLKKALEWHARESGYLLPQFLFQLDKVPGAWENPRERRLNEGEWDKLLDAGATGRTNKEIWPHVLTILVETACRSGELMKAKVSELNLDGRAWNIPPENAKTKSSIRQVPLSKKAGEAFGALTKGKKDTDRVIDVWADSNSFGHSFKWLCHRARVDDLHVHDLRHEGCSRLVERGNLSVIEIMSITGHSDPRTLKRYSNLRASSLASKLD